MVYLVDMCKEKLLHPFCCILILFRHLKLFHLKTTSASCSIEVAPVMFCNSQLVNKVGCFRVLVVFSLWISQIGKRIPNPYMGQEYPFFFFLVMGISHPSIFPDMGIKCPNIFPDMDFSHPKNSPRWDFSVPNIIWYGVLMSQKCPSCEVWLSHQFH